mmetsp:Transcript_7776/g.20017  ORF Transcript_7776/g.20017 Transcript_7776/m.20017 type:complete len:595 (+) Transcript_7776:616-2400(+)
MKLWTNKMTSAKQAAARQRRMLRKRKTLTGVDFKGLFATNIEYVSITSRRSDQLEEVVIRQPRWGKNFQIPVLAKGQTLSITLTHGGTATVSAEALAGDPTKANAKELNDIKVPVDNGPYDANLTLHSTRTKLKHNSGKGVAKLQYYAQFMRGRSLLTTFVAFVFLLVSTRSLLLDPLRPCVALSMQPAGGAEVAAGVAEVESAGSNAKIHFDQVVVESVDEEGGLAAAEKAGGAEATAGVGDGSAASEVCFSTADTRAWLSCAVGDHSMGGLVLIWLLGMMISLMYVIEALLGIITAHSNGYDVSLIDEEVTAGELPPVPIKFVQGTVNDGGMPEAVRRWKITYNWRMENDIDNLLEKAQPDFDVIKKYYPHFWCGIAKKGSICYYEKCGYVDLKALKAAGVTVPQLIEYYTFMTEYMWNVIAPDEDGPNSQCLTIFDVKNVSLFDVVGEVLTFIKGTSGIAGAHYPERCANILIVNAPGIFSSVWKLIKPMIAPATQEKVRIAKAGEETTNEMLTLIDLDQLPEEYGGTFKPGDGKEEACRWFSPEEIGFRKFVYELNKKNGLSEPYGHDHGPTPRRPQLTEPRRGPNEALS